MASSSHLRPVKIAPLSIFEENYTPWNSQGKSAPGQEVFRIPAESARGAGALGVCWKPLVSGSLSRSSVQHGKVHQAFD